jgi:hypothetical protein
MTITYHHSDNYILIQYDSKAIAKFKAKGHYPDEEYLNYYIGRMNDCIKKSIEHLNQSSSSLYLICVL